MARGESEMIIKPFQSPPGFDVFCFVFFLLSDFLHSQSFLGHARSLLGLPSPHVGGVDGGFLRGWLPTGFLPGL